MAHRTVFTIFSQRSCPNFKKLRLIVMLVRTSSCTLDPHWEKVSFPGIPIMIDDTLAQAIRSKRDIRLPSICGSEVTTRIQHGQNAANDKSLKPSLHLQAGSEVHAPNADATSRLTGE